MISRKTGALAACSAELGALAAGADDVICDGFRDMGNRMGMAWQISLDIENLWGQWGDGMTPSNVLNKKKSLPLIYALENAPVAAKRELGNIYMKRVLQPEDVSRVVSILDEANAWQFAEGEARELARGALLALAETGLPEERLASLHQLSDWVLEGHAGG
jgi:geranylgeranyl diphosphate synthase type I